MSLLFRAVIGVSLWVVATGAMAATQAEIDQARNKGLAWLFSNQTGEGSWKNSSGLQIQPTAAVLEAFLNAGIKQGYSYAAAEAWLGNAEAISIESLSRQSIALFRSGANVAPLMSRLTAMRHTRTKSWGAYDQYSGSFPDTSLAMDALTLTGTSYADTGSSLGFIGGKQNTDGGWPYTAGEPVTPQSRVIPTAHNLITLSRYKTIGWVVDTNITNGVNWLVARKKADDGFADDPSVTTGTIYETALAYLALAEAKKAGNAAAIGAQAVIDGALNFLIARQQADGSWGNDPFQTALALQTLPVVTLTDTDKDGIPDPVETPLGTNPTVADGRGLVKSNGQSISGVTAPALVGSALLSQPFSTTLTAGWGTAPYTWSIVSGSLPDGLSLNGTTGTISGTPTTLGTFNFTHKATDSKGSSNTVVGQIGVTTSGAMAAMSPVTFTASSVNAKETAVSPSLAVSVSPASIAEDFAGTVGITVTNLAAPGTEVLVEQMVDANRNGVVDISDYIIRSFTVSDGVASSNPNTQGDENGAVDSTIATSLNYRLANDLYHAAGYYIFRITQGAESVMAAFTVEPVSRLQTISGTVTDGITSILGGIVRLLDKWQRHIAFVIADDTGQYTFNVKEPGVYSVAPYAYGYSTVNAGVTPITLAASQDIINKDLSMVTGVYHVAGRVKDDTSGAGIAGVWVKATGTDYSGVAITGATGGYDLLLPGGRYVITVTTDVAEPNAFAKGYAGYDNQPVSVNLTRSVKGIDFALPKAGDFASGRVLDQFGLGVSGLPVQGKVTAASDAREPVGYGITDADGIYTLGIIPSDNWNIFLNESTAQTSGYLGTVIRNNATVVGTPTGNNLTAHSITAWVQGTVKDSNGNPLKGVEVTIRNADLSVVCSVASASDGSYRLGAYAGDWLVDALTENSGYVAVPEQGITLADGQTVTKDYTVTVAKPNGKKQ